ncbi:5'-nucleotidase C-terminal domain-containing protein [Aquiflexum lacus]|uniref:5'-nucleotidase C-terminal domain-containing protein n=1 Tax=Aquiflexum lacus TaxID=2483805 RepID=UPI001893E34E|nr:5'-nucleotidase [Aquiflexum lacus]
MNKTILYLSLCIALCSLTNCAPSLYQISNSENLSVTEQVEIDPTLDNYIQPYKFSLESEMNEVIGQTEYPILKTGVGETPLGNLIADLQKEFAEEVLGYPIDISIMNNGGIRNTLPKGNITVSNIFELSPFENYLYILELEGEDVRHLAAAAIQKKNLGISGMELESLDGKLITLKVNGADIDASKTYLLALNDYLAEGGDGMEFAKNLPRKEQSGYLIREILIQQIRKKTERGEKIKAEIEGRQKIK